MIKPVRVGESARTQCHNAMSIRTTTVATVVKLHVHYLFGIVCFCLFVAPAFAQKVKKEVILYKKAHAVAVGYTCKGKFVNNSHITIYYLPYSAKYRKKERDNEVYFKGKYGEETLSSLNIIADGIYYKTNGRAYIKGEYHPTAFVTYKGNFLVYNSLDDIDVVVSAKKAYFFKFKIINADYCHIKDDNTWELFISKEKEQYSIKANFLESDNLKALKGTVPLKAIDINNLDYHKAFNLLSKIDYAEMTFKNGDFYKGVLRIEAQGKISENWRITWSRLSGDYKYATGETFKGLWHPISITGENNNLRISIPTEGVMTFKDGQSVKGNWLAKFTFKGSEWKEIFDENKGPTDIRDKAIALKKKKDAEIREKRRREAELRSKEQIRLRQEQARRRFLINKYGVSNGTLLAEGKIELGMTKEMVNEVWSQQIYDITKTVSYGKIAEVWTINPNIWALNNEIPRMLIFIDDRLSSITE